MMYSGFVVMYTYSENHPDKSTHFEGLFNTIDEARTYVYGLESLKPTVDNIRIGRVVIDPNNPKLY